MRFFDALPPMMEAVEPVVELDAVDGAQHCECVSMRTARSCHFAHLRRVNVDLVQENRLEWDDSNRLTVVDLYRPMTILWKCNSFGWFDGRAADAFRVLLSMGLLEIGRKSDTRFC